MAKGILYAVFVLPVIFSIIFGSVVLADVLQEPDRELNMWQVGMSERLTDSSIQIIGLAEQYTISSPVKIFVSIDDANFACGDLYVTIYSGKNVVTQSGFLEQCFGKNMAQLPIDDEFSEIINVPGQYELIAEMRDKNQKHTISASEKFTVK
ncbi:MAG: hypothetical protein OEM18_01450 [Nitrosopumilus sp.]|jgi:hypothetical protein|nr:hypothetical protein [Nitrosopumilus sp.]MDH3501632.1 hypothetical protein [Nitrosopumilus sp.]